MSDQLIHSVIYVTLHKLDGHIQQIYLVEEPQGLMLLDGCCRADVGKVLRFIRDTLKRPIEDLRVVVVTHMHPDHAGGANKLRAITGCSVVTGIKPHQWYRGLEGRVMHLTDVMLAGWVAGRLGKPRKNLWYSPKLFADYRLTDGDSIPGFDEWQVVDTPGHTDRDISLLHIPTQKMYVADMMVLVKQKFIPPFPVFHPNKYRASLEKIRDMRPQSLLLAHGGEVSLNDEQFDFLMSKAPKRPATHWGATKFKLKQVMGRN